MTLHGSIGAEQAVIGGLLYDAALYWECEFLRPEHFSEAFYGACFQWIVEQVKAGKTASPILLAGALNCDDKGKQAIEAACAAVPSAIAVRDYAEAVRDLGVAREVAVAASQIADSARKVRTADDLAQCLGAIDDLAREASEDALGTEQVSDLGDQASGWLGEWLEPSEGITGLSTGLKALDDLTGGFQPGSLYVVAARPSMGKTAMALNLLRACVEQNKSAFFASCEMPRKDIYARLLADFARNAPNTRVYYNSLIARRGGWSQADVEALIEAQGVLQASPIAVDERSTPTATQIAAGARRAFRRLGARGFAPGVIVIDYLQLMKRDASVRSDLSVGENAAAMKALAKDLGVPVVLLSQLNRSVEQRDDKRPNLGDLRESGNIEEHADLVAFLLRPEYYVSKQDFDSEFDRAEALSAARGKLRLFIDKNRNGATTEIMLDVDIACNAIRDQGRLYGPPMQSERAA